MKISSADFVVSNSDVSKCPDSKLPEYAFIGRSNVGKSSLINMLTNKKGLAMTSSKPGKTLLINHFIINGEWHLVDLPGYGFAQAGKANRERLRKMIESYILMRNQLTNLFLLIDSRHARRAEPEPVKGIAEAVCTVMHGVVFGAQGSQPFDDFGVAVDCLLHMFSAGMIR